MNNNSICIIQDEQLAVIDGSGALKIAATALILGPLFGSIYLAGVVVG